MATESNSVCFKCYVPHKPLSDLVGLFWYWRGYEFSQARERILPAGTVELVIKLNDGGSGIAGPSSRFFEIERRMEDELLGIHFKEGGAFPFFPFPISDLHNRGSSVAETWGTAIADELIDRVHKSSSIDAIFRVLEKWLLFAAERPLRRHSAVEYAMKEFRRNPAVSSDELAKKIGFSQRRFIQLFREEVGLTPKLFCRVQRFQQVIQGLKNRDQIDWADVALGAGYYDQAHFIHDFREFTGFAPTEYLPLRTVHLNHLKVGD